MDSLFTSTKEKNLWAWALVVLLAIFSTLFLGQPLIDLMADQNVRAIFFSLGLLLVAATALLHGLKRKPSAYELTLLIGLIAVYLMWFLRLGMPERTHLIEYSVLAIFIHNALRERAKLRKPTIRPSVMSIILTFLNGVVDEGIQLVLPDRRFDMEDIFFNGSAIIMAIVSSMVLGWARRFYSRK